ncbi:A disintegrin and metalloproteinase with thrombospondin motifs 20 [Mactra antiquata]
MEQPLKELWQVQNDLYERRKVKNDDTPEVLYERRKNDDDDEVKRKEEKEDEVTVAYETLEHELTVAYDTVENELVDAVLKCMRLKATIARSCQMLKTMKEKKQELKIQYVLYENRRKEEARKSWLDKLGSETDAIDTINEYFGQVANNMDLRFSSVSRTNEISVDIVPYTITIDQTGNTWVTDYPVSGTDYYNAENALYAFYEWGLTNIDNNCDSIMLFTMYNLGQGSDDSLVGLAQAYSYTDGASINAMCFNGDYGVLSVSIVEDLRQGDTSSTAAHELAHTMGVQHDEDSSGDCVYDNEYIMSPNSSVASTDDDSLAANPWKFSSCSIQEIIDNTDSDFNACLQENTYDTNDYADVQAGSTLGELYNRDKQCQLIHGSASSYCTGTGITVSEICQRGLPCVNPDDSSSCPIIEPFHGTKCGKNKRVRRIID